MRSFFDSCVFRQIYFLSLLFVLSCKGTNKSLDTIVPDRNNIDSILVDSAVCLRVAALPDSAGIDVILCKKMYKEFSFKAFWTKNEIGLQKVDTLLGFLKRGNEHGLPSNGFKVDSLTLLLEQYKQNDLSYPGIARLEINTSLAFLKYCRILAFGLAESTDYFEGNYIFRQTADSLFALQCMQGAAENLTQLLNDLQPRDSNYLALQQTRKYYLQLKDSLFDSIPALAERKTVKLYANDSIIAFIIKRLQMTGELEFRDNTVHNNDYFDDELLRALNKFRYKTGLFIDEEIGNHTIRALNMSFADYVLKIDANLERLRWKPALITQAKYIRVNVADMSLKAYRNDTLLLKMNVVVGKTGKNKTPLLLANIHELVLNPTWTIPNSIILEETSKLQAKDSSYLRRHKMRVFHKKLEIDPQIVEWSKISKKNQPYVIVQDSGNMNALGRIKFNFANRFSVYLHDTNVRSVFARHNRALSHGCVRVEKPLDLAFFCLPDYDTKDLLLVEKRKSFEDKIRFSIGQKPISEAGILASETDSSFQKIKKLQIQPSIPLLIEYYTCFRNEKGEVIFRDDIYGMDAALIAYLQKNMAD